MRGQNERKMKRTNGSTDKEKHEQTIKRELRNLYGSVKGKRRTESQDQGNASGCNDTHRKAG